MKGKKFKLLILKRSVIIKVLLVIALMISATISVNSAVEMVSSQNTESKPTPSTKNLPIYSVHTDEQVVAMSFDAAWGADDTDELLSILEEYDVKTTFFVCGYWVEKHPEQVKKIFEAGHDIGNHSATHAHVGKLGLEKNKEEIQRTHDIVKDLLGIEMNLYRPPYGEYNDTVLKAAKELGYHVIQWDVDSHDWMKKGVEYQVNRVLNHKNLKNGSIILFHNDSPYTPEALGITIEGLREKGFDIIPVSELIHTEDYYMDYTGRQFVK